MGKTPTLCDKMPSPGILPHHSDKSLAELSFILTRILFVLY